jgi:hypothetical protein
MANDEDWQPLFPETSNDTDFLLSSVVPFSARMVLPVVGCRLVSRLFGHCCLLAGVVVAIRRKDPVPQRD